MLSLLNTASVRKQRNDCVHAALNYMGVHFRERLSVSDIVHAAEISPSRLYALFQAQMGISPMAYLNQQRLSSACLLLESTDKPVREIAEMCGIDDVFYFSKLFKKELSSFAQRVLQSLSLYYNRKCQRIEKR